MRLAVIFALFTMAVAQSTRTGGAGGPPPCFKPPSCRFSLRSGSLITLGTPDVPLTGPIELDDKIVGRVSTTGEAFVNGDNGPVGLTEVGLGFSSSFFKSYDINDNSTTKSGIGHEVIQGNQGAFFQFTCVGVPVLNYQVLGDNGQVIDNLEGRDRFTDCISFRALPPM